MSAAAATSDKHGEYSQPDTQYISFNVHRGSIRKKRYTRGGGARGALWGLIPNL